MFFHLPSHWYTWILIPSRNYEYNHEKDCPRRLITKNDWPRSIFTTTTTAAQSDDVECSTPSLFCILHLCTIFWLMRTCPCATFDIYEDVSEWIFPIVFYRRERTMGCFHCKKTWLYLDFDTRSHECAVSNISHWFTNGDASLQNCINRDTWRRASFH